MNSNPRFPIPLMVFTTLYFVGFSIAAFQNGNSEFILYIGVMAFLIWGIFTIHRRCQLSLPLLWCLSIWGLLHMAGGIVAIPTSWPYNPPNNVLYSLWLIPDKLKYDQITHAYGFGITTWLCWEALRNGLRSRFKCELTPTVGTLVLCVGGGMGFGAFNEVIEFFATISLPNTNVGGYMNTGWDLVYNMIGSAVVAVVIYFRCRGDQSNLTPGAEGESESA